MARADRLSQLITKWQDDHKTLLLIESYFREHQNRTCVEIAEFGRRVLERCISDFQRANYPLDRESVRAFNDLTSEEAKSLMESATKSGAVDPHATK